MYSNIIVPLDGSDAAARALGPAAALAHEYDTTVTILSVVSPSFVPSMTETARDQAAAAGIDSPHINIVVSHRSPVPKLIDALNDDPGSLLCLSTTGRSHFGQVLGSVAEELLRVRTGPFLLIGPHCESDAFKPRGKLLVPVDGSEPSTEILPLAAAWAIAYELDPEVVGVAHDAHAAPELPGALAKAAQHVEDDVGRKVTWEVLHDKHAAKAIVERATAIDAAAVAMTTHGKTGLGRVLVGSVTIEVVHHAPCPVLVHRPLRLRT